MRLHYSLIAATFLTLIFGCKKAENPTEPVVPPVSPLVFSVSELRDSMRYTLKITDTTFSLHGPISASLTLYNEGEKPVSFHFDSVFHSRWFLFNASGRVIFYAPLHNRPGDWYSILDHGATWETDFEETISDSLAADVAPGIYKLEAGLVQENFRNLSILLSLK